MQRRNVIVGGMAGAAGLALTSAAALAGRHRKSGSGPLDHSLNGDYLDFTTTAGNREAFARIMGRSRLRHLQDK